MLGVSQVTFRRLGPSHSKMRRESGSSQPDRKKVQGSMQRIARIKHRCRQHNKEIVTKNRRHYVTVEKEHMKCRMCAQTRPFDKVTIFLTQQCPAADQTNWMMRIQQLKSEMDVDKQGRVGDIRNLLVLQANTPRPKEKERGCDAKTADKSWLRKQRIQPEADQA